MFSVIVSEKGGPERRETFESSEINVGRVPDNDLTLPKSNVSKRHARVLYRDGRFIVTDLKSTNGTYVNGRKIAQATIVREGDKIYIGDFILRVEAAPTSPLMKAPSRNGASPSAPPAESELPDPPFALRPPEQASNLGAHRAEPVSGVDQDLVSHFPLDRDPDEHTSQNVVAASQLHRAPMGRPSSPGFASPEPATSLTKTATTLSVPPPSTMTSGQSQPPMQGRRRASGTFDMEGRTQAPPPPAASHGTLSKLMERLSAIIDISALDTYPSDSDTLITSISQALSDCVATMKIAGELRDIDSEALLLAARRELFELGPLTSALLSEEFSSVLVAGHASVLFMQGRKAMPSEFAFSSEQAVLRVIQRLCALSERPLLEGEAYVQRRLPRGVQMTAILPPMSEQGHVIVLRLPQHNDTTVDDLVRTGTVSRTMASFLSICASVGANILIVGARGANPSMVLSALAQPTSIEERAVLVQDDDGLTLSQPSSITLAPREGNEGEAIQAVAAVSRLCADKIVINLLSAPPIGEVLDVILQGTQGVLMAMRAPTLKHALGRVCASSAMRHPGIALDAIYEAIANSFDLVLEVTKLRDGRHRVTRVAELLRDGSELKIRDIWTFVVDRTASGGTIEGTFQASGVVPVIAEDLVARGELLDASLFKRHASR